jgi:hypothetical protein
LNFSYSTPAITFAGDPSIGQAVFDDSNCPEGFFQSNVVKLYCLAELRFIVSIQLVEQKYCFVSEQNIRTLDSQRRHNHQFRDRINLRPFQETEVLERYQCRSSVPWGVTYANGQNEFLSEGLRENWHLPSTCSLEVFLLRRGKMERIWFRLTISGHAQNLDVSRTDDRLIKSDNVCT